MRNHLWTSAWFSLVVMVGGAAFAPQRMGGGHRPPPALIQCGQGSGNSVTHQFSPNQTDSLVLNGHKLIVPQGAVSQPTQITMRELPTPLIKLRLQANGSERFAFAKGQHATLVVSYARCDQRNEIAQQQTAVYRLRSNDLPDASPLSDTPLPSRPYPSLFETRASLSRLSGYGVGRLDGGP